MTLIRQYCVAFLTIILLAACGATPSRTANNSHNDISAGIIEAAPQRSFAAADNSIKAQPNAITNPDNTSDVSARPCCTEPASASSVCRSETQTFNLAPGGGNGLFLLSNGTVAVTTKGTMNPGAQPMQGANYSYSVGLVNVRGDGANRLVSPVGIDIDYDLNMSIRTPIPSNTISPINGVQFANFSGVGMTVSATSHCS
jgi:hypothetical protein